MRLLLTDGKGVNVYDCSPRAFTLAASMRVAPGCVLNATDIEHFRTKKYVPAPPPQPQPLETA